MLMMLSEMICETGGYKRRGCALGSGCIRFSRAGNAGMPGRL